MTRHPQQIDIDEYDYLLPDERIAKFPLAERDASKLLIYNKGNISESWFRNLVDYLPEKTLLVRNNTRVVQARVLFFKETGARIEVFCLEPHSPSDYVVAFQQREQCEWTCMIGNLKKWKEGMLTRRFDVDGHSVTLTAERIDSSGLSHTVRFSWDSSSLTFADILEDVGELPIPPYLNRETEESDKETYQTVYAKVEGSVAAPTAGLHFTDSVLEDLEKHAIRSTEVTLHVGAGTFQPVKSKSIGDHTMHSEMISVTKDTLEELLRNLGSIVAVGTTSVRTLESLYFLGRQLTLSPETFQFQVKQWEPYNSTSLYPSAEEALSALIDYMNAHQLQKLDADTQIIIAPGYKFRLISGMITNFHQPKSTLLLLISAFVGSDWKKIYDYAFDNEFRFLSYGDSSLLLP
jgi:S-adenosylmethionine:tRNA-ribosyltransferase-isomerase (queuine synthetase)